MVILTWKIIGIPYISQNMLLKAAFEKDYVKSDISKSFDTSHGDIDKFIQNLKRKFHKAVIKFTMFDTNEFFPYLNY